MITSKTLRTLLLITLSALGVACASEVTSMVPARPLVDGGAPSDGAPADVATPDDAAPDDAPPWMPPEGTDTACVSGVHWTLGNRRSPLMNPGQACVACHVSRAEGPRGVAGTAYYLNHEMNNCDGYTGSTPEGPSGTAYVELVDANGVMARLTINSAGNFYRSASMAFPLRSARVIGPTGLVNEMGSPVPNGDCNSCHTQDGTTTEPGGDDAPGRITVPL